MRSNFTLVALGLLASGCTTFECEVHNPWVGDPLKPSIESIEVTGASQGSAGTVSVGMHVAGLDPYFVREVLLEYRSTAEENLPFVLVGEMAETTSHQYEASLPSVDYGPYEVCVQATLRRGPSREPEPKPDTVLVDRAEFSNGPGPDCFTFVQDETSGWSTEGVFDVATGERITAPEQMYLGGGVFGAGLGLLCLPNVPSGPIEGGQWYLDYISGPLADSGQWQDATEAVFKVSAPNGTKAQPIFVYLQDDGEEHFYAEQDDEDFDDVSGTAEFVDPTFNAGQGPLVRLRVRVFGDYMLTTPETWVNLHFVCPLHGAE